MSYTIKGFHGTLLSNFEKIKTRNFLISNQNWHYLGKGVYFYIDDFAENGKTNALDWAKKKFKKKIEKNICVIDVDINVMESKLLDLTTKEGLMYYNFGYQNILDKIKNQRNKKLTSDKSKNISGEVINHLKQTLNFFYVKAWTSTHFNILAQNNIFSAIANGCEFCVMETKQIKLNSINKSNEYDVF